MDYNCELIEQPLNKRQTFELLLKNANTYDDCFKTILFQTNSNTNICYYSDSPRVENLKIEHQVLRK